jgi:two-component system response regulator VicR
VIQVPRASREEELLLPTKILVVDDDPRIGSLLACLLQDGGYAPLVAQDAATAALLFDKEWPELVILDVDLGESNGLDLLRTFKHQRSTPIIVLPGIAAEEVRLWGFEVGADDYVTKPFGNMELLARIHARLRRGGAPLPY